MVIWFLKLETLLQKSKQFRNFVYANEFSSKLYIYIFYRQTQRKAQQFKPADRQFCIWLIIAWADFVFSPSKIENRIFGDFLNINSPFCSYEI